MVLFNHLVADARPVIHTLNMGRGNYLHQVAVTLVVLGQQNKMVVFRVSLVLKVMVIAAGNVNLAADDGFYRRMFCGVLEELLYPVHIAVVRDGKTGHSKFLGAVEQIGY